MHDFNNYNKVSGVYWLKTPINELKIKVKLKAQDSIVALPKFDDYTNGASNHNVNQLDNNLEEYTFKWQEKAFNAQEHQYYAESYNCLADYEHKYHEMIKNNSSEFSKVFTYINEDNYCPLPYERYIKNDNDMNSLRLYLERLMLDDGIGNLLDNHTESSKHLFKSDINLTRKEQEWMSMHIMFDNSKYNEDLHLLMKREAILVSLYYNKLDHCLILKPNVNNIDYNPYSLESSSGTKWNYKYAIELQNDIEDENDEEFVDLMKRLQKKWDRKNRHLLEFDMPPMGIKRYYVTLEILTAKDFENDDLYIDFKIKIPEDVHCEEPLSGCTHTSKSMRVDGGAIWNFGHLVQVQLDCKMEVEDTPKIQLFIEVISRDWWGRDRTEGYSHLSIPLDPGHHTRNLSTVRPEERDRVLADSRRFFLGGCHLLKDLEILAAPQEFMERSFRWRSSGAVRVRWRCARAAPARRAGAGAGAGGRGADAVLRRYGRARARLAAAAGDLQLEDRGVDDVS